MDGHRPVLANPQSAEAVQPGQRPLHHPADLPQATAMLGPAAGDERPDTASTQLAAMLVRVEASVAVQAPRPTPRPTGLAAHRWDRIDQRDHRHDIRDVGRSRGGRQGHAVSIRDDRVLAALLAAVYRAGSGLLPTTACPHEAAVDDGAVPIDLVRTLQLGQQDLVQLLPEAGSRPVAEPAPAGHTTTAAHLAGQILPVDAGLQDEEDAGQALAVVDRLAAGEAEPARLGWGQQRSDPLPQLIDDEWLGHGDPPFDILSTSEGSPKIVILLGPLTPRITLEGGGTRYCVPYFFNGEGLFIDIPRSRRGLDTPHASRPGDTTRAIRPTRRQGVRVLGGLAGRDRPAARY